MEMSPDLNAFLYGPTTKRPANPVRGQEFFDTTLNSPIWWNGSAWGSIAPGGTGGAAGSIQYNQGGAFAGSADLTWDPTDKNFTAGDGATIHGGAQNAVAMGFQAEVAGVGATGSVALGFQAKVTVGLGVAIGNLCESHSAGGTAIGELCDVPIGGDNAIAMGYSSTASGADSACFGTSCISGGDGSFAGGIGANCPRNGEWAHQVQTWEYQGRRRLQMYADLTGGVAGDLHLPNAGGEFTPDAGYAYHITAHFLASKTEVAGALPTKIGCETHDILLAAPFPNGDAQIFSDNLLSPPALGTDTKFSTQGWTLTISVPVGTGFLRFAFDPAGDPVKVGVTLFIEQIAVA